MKLPSVKIDITECLTASETFKLRCLVRQRNIENTAQFRDLIADIFATGLRVIASERAPRT